MSKISKVLGKYKFFIRTDTRDCDVVQSCTVEDEYVLDILQGKNSVLLDIGTHIGGFTVKALHNGASKVYSVEICKENVELIKTNVKFNGFSCKHFNQEGETSVTIIDKAIHDNDNGIYVDMNASYNKGQDSEYEFQHRHVYACYDTSETPVANKNVFFESISLDTIFNKLNISRLNIMKIDCEGAEWRALYGASDDTLDKIDIIVGEFNPIPNFYIGEKLIKCEKGGDLLELIGHKFKDVTDNVKLLMNNKQKTWYKNLNSGTGLFLYVLLNKKYNNIFETKI
jgi:FkbM family methyltransferase